MLRRTVSAATSTLPLVPGDGEDIQVYGVNLGLDESIINAITKARESKSEERRIVDEEEIEWRESGLHWVPLLSTVLWVYRATPHAATGLSPALLAMGKELVLPFDAVEEPTPRTDEMHRELIAKRLQWVVDAIPGLQELQNRGRTGKDPDTNPKFSLGQKVWKRESKYDGKGFVPVFAPRWTGPFIIHSIYDKGVYKLRTVPTEGKNTGYLRNPVNGARLKAFVEGDVLP